VGDRHLKFHESRDNLGDDLAVAGLEPEPMLSGPILVDLELACHRYSFSTCVIAAL
jgi:hypothetical protein